MNFNIFNSLILAGVIQGLVFGFVVLSSKKRRSPAAIALVSLIVVFSLNNLQYFLQDSGVISSRQLFVYLWLPWQLLSGALLLFYGICLLHPDKRLSTRAKIAVVPFTIGVIALLVWRIAVFSDYKNPAFYTFYEYFLGFVEFFSIAYCQAIVLWLLFETRRVKTDLEKSKDRHFVRPRLNWFFKILIVFFAASFLWLYVGIQTIITGRSEQLWYFVWIFMSIMIYWLGHIGIYKFGIHEQRRKIRHEILDKVSVAAPLKPKNGHALAFEQLMIGKKRFLDPDLTLDAVAEELEVSKSHLSRIVNVELGMSFPDYVNSLRVEEAKSYLSDAGFANYTLVAIGLEAGFASKTTFNNTFRKFTGVTPSEFKNSGKGDLSLGT